VSDLISRQDAIEALGEEPPVWYDGDDEIAERNQWRRDKAAIESLPSAEPKTGEWDDIGGFIRWGCPFCHHAYESRSNYCPNCGARMRGEEA
jgi:rubrerythrin